MLLCLILGHSIPVPKIRGGLEISCSEGNVFDAEWPYVISNWYLSKQVSLFKIMILKKYCTWIEYLNCTYTILWIILVWLNWSDFCCFNLVVQLNNISSINGHYYNRIKHLFLMYCYTGVQVSLSLSMNKNYSCYIPLWDTDFATPLPKLCSHWQSH